MRRALTADGDALFAGQREVAEPPEPEPFDFFAWRFPRSLLVDETRQDTRAQEPCVRTVSRLSGKHGVLGVVLMRSDEPLQDRAHQARRDNDASRDISFEIRQPTSAASSRTRT